jgi:molecular chaperone HtpG
MSTADTHAFKAEVDALLDLVTHSLYTNPEVFLRELVSNAADALDKARFEALVHEGLRDRDVAPEIRIRLDETNGVLTIEDTGIGMTKEEAERNLGTVAHSGTLAYLREAKASGRAVDLIGQFGVGFYSAFMVADRVVVNTLSALPGQEAVQWSSTGRGTFTLEPGSRAARGTSIALHLKQDAKEYLQRWRVEGIVKRYSNYVVHPIVLEVLDAEGKPSGEAKRVNAESAIWTRKESEVSEDDYREFYTHVMGGFLLPGDEPTARLHLAMDAPIQFQALLFVPSRAPTDLFQESRKAIQLYARRVLVMDSCDRLLPQYLRFFRGVVDSEDLPLNVSREMLQEHSSLSAIRRQLTRKALKLLAEKAKDDAGGYAKLWREFGAVVKEGLTSDHAHRKELLEICKWPSVAALTTAGGATDEDALGGALTTLGDYVAKMPPEQDAIYYVAGEDAAALLRSPHIEALRAKGWDVLLATDPIDEFALQQLGEVEGKALKSAAAETEAEDETKDAESGPLADVVAATKHVLGERVRDVRVSSRLRNSAACLVDPADGMSANMERALRMARQPVAARPRILEINPEHAITKKLAALVAADASSPDVTRWTELVFDLAALADGTVPDPAATVARLQGLMVELAST